MLIGSCRKNELKADKTLSPVYVATSSNILYKEGTSTLTGGNKRNPYTVSNMAAAWQNLAGRGILPSGKAGVYTTHYYVKFKPQNTSQYEDLQSDTSLDIYDLPIESTVIRNGDYYHDPELADSVPTYQYTAVKAGYVFSSDIPYEIIDSLYIPETDSIFDYENGGTQDLFVDKLLNQAYTQAGNYEDTIALDNLSAYEARYTPGGRIRVFDTRLSEWIGMEGIKVKARRWFITYTGYPDYGGYYRMNHGFKRPCNYSVWFGNALFAVRHNLVNTTYWINGPKISGDWNYDLNNGYQRFAGHVFRGAYRYQFKDIGGLKRPWFSSIGKRQIYIAKNGYKSSSGINWIIFPVIRIARYEDENGSEYDSDEIFSTTCHETAHTSHMLRMNGDIIQFAQVDAQLQESWAVAIEWYLSHIEYAERGISNYGEADYYPDNYPQYPNDYAYQYWNGGVHKKYTSLYINIVDTVNELNKIYTGYGLGTVDDKVNGYTLPAFEKSMLKHSYGLSSLGVQLKANKPAGITDEQIDLLLSFYKFN